MRTRLKFNDPVGFGHDTIKVGHDMYLKMLRMRMLDKVDVKFIPPKLGSGGFGYYIIKPR